MKLHRNILEIPNLVRYCIVYVQLRLMAESMIGGRASRVSALGGGEWGSAIHFGEEKYFDLSISADLYAARHDVMH